MNREEWLHSAVGALAPVLEQGGVRLPEKLKISVGFPGGGSARKRIGECWKSSTAKDGASNIFISPLLDEPVKVLATLVHELIHAADDCESGHKGAFVRMAKACGLVGPWTATSAGEGLADKLAGISAGLPEYPHAAISLTERETKKQTTRMLKVECEVTGYTLRTTKKWLDEYGAPICPCCGAVMEVEKKEEEDDD